jgi:hypothetical protein
MSESVFLRRKVASAIDKFDESESQLERLSQLVTGLYEKYGNDGDVHTELLIELAAVDYWRHARSLDFETVSLADPRTLVRYNTANRRALLKTLDMLEEVRREKVGGESSHVEPAGSGAPESVARRPRPRARVQQIAPCSTIFR